MIISHKFWHIAKSLQNKNLQQSKIKNLDFSESDLFNLNIGKRGGDFFLGYYSKEGVILAFKKYGVYVELKNLGFDKVITVVDTLDLYKHKISFFKEEKNQKNLLIELEL